MNTIKIKDKEYELIDIKPEIQNKMYLRHGKKYGKVGEILPPSKKNSKARAKLIEDIVAKPAIYNLIRQGRFYRIPFITRKINNIKKYRPDDLNGNSVGDVITDIQELGAKVFIHGGLIRDIFLKKRSYDIDLVFDTNTDKISEICKDKYPCGLIDEKTQYINFGSDKGASVEGANMRNVFLIPFYFHEATVNDFVYDLQNDVLIDLSGFGLNDIAYNLVRLSATPDKWDKWAKSDFKRPLRYFKLIQKGFRPINKKMHNFVVNYIVDNYDNLYDKEINPVHYPIKRIKHFFIKTLTQGEFDSKTGEYFYGPTKDKLIPYLEILRANLPIEIFRKTISIFTKEDMKMLKSRNIISTLNRYILETKQITTSEGINNISNIIKSNSKTKKRSIVKKIEKTKKSKK